MAPAFRYPGRSRLRAHARRSGWYILVARAGASLFGGAKMMKRATIGLLSIISVPLLAQTPTRVHTDRPKDDPVFSDLASFYASLPVVQPRSLDKTLALQLSTMPLS